MKKIDIEFVNIQSHEHTVFHLQPGLNFILAEDNNVGKSTIFKVLLCAMQLPQVSIEDIDTLIRSGTTQARATFKFDDTTCTLWLFRGNGSASRAFFELDVGDGNTTRSLGAPTCLREAFDIVSGEDGKVVNFNDADSVQLIVQDTPKNDEVLAQVLVDLKVDNIKANAVRLRQQIHQDYVVAKSKLDDVTHTLSTMQYIDSVDSFKSERDLLSSACDIADVVCPAWSTLEDLGPQPPAVELTRLRRALSIAESLSDIDTTDPAILNAVSPELFEDMKKYFAVLDALDQAVRECPQGTLIIQPTQLSNAAKGIQVLDCLTSAIGSLSFVQSAVKEMEQLTFERESILRKLGEVAPRVKCPIKGEVFYGDDECIPCGDGPSL